MSRLANKAILIPKGVVVTIHPDYAEIKGPKKTIEIKIYPQVKLVTEHNEIHVSYSQKKESEDKASVEPMVGTTWALLKNALIGVSEGFKIELELVGVGYRAQIEKDELKLTLGFSHPVAYKLPKDVTAETPSQTEIVLVSHDNQLLGKVAADICSYRPPEPYKGKGIKRKGQEIVRKETKKK